MSIETGVLYIIATPIGNLGDVTQRAKEMLARVDVLYAEDTRHSKRLLNALGISAKLFSLHDYNEAQRIEKIQDALASGQSVGLISDAGTPLISDPGYKLVSSCVEKGFRVSPIPGASALVAALSVCGLPTDRFCFEGFLPAKRPARRARLACVLQSTATLIFYESSHRISDSIEDMLQVFGGERVVCIARELTKTYETVKTGRLSELVDWLQGDANQQRGEFVVIVEGAKPAASEDDDEVELRRVLSVLLQTVTVKDAVKIAVQLCGVKKKVAYQQALTMQSEMSE